MTRTSPSTGSIASVLTICLLAAGVVGGGVPVAAEHADDGGGVQFVAEQGDRCVPLQTAGDGTENVSTFYDYRGGPGTAFSSYGTTELQESGVSQVFVHHGSEGVSLVFLHDELADGDGGGAVSMTVSGLPAEGTWAVEDDSYADPDDRFRHDGATSEVDWLWAPNRTDGAAFRGLDALDRGDAVAVDARFGNASYGGETGWPYASDDVSWAARNDEGALVDLDPATELRVRPGTCEPITATLAVSPAPASAGESVTLDASNATAGAGITEYRWDVDGDGTVEDETTAPTLTHAYDEAGTVTPSVTVVGADGETTTADTSLSVTEATPPNASAAIDPATVEPGEPVHVDGTNSTAGSGIVAYEWAFGDGTTATGPTAEHAYDAPGTYEIELTVEDATGDRDATTVQVTVAEPDEPPTPSVAAPATATVGEPIAFDGSNSTDDDAVDSHAWAFGDGATATGPTVEHAYDAPGSYEVTLTVTDAGGNEAATTHAVTVAAANDTDDGNGSDGSDGANESDGDDGTNESEGGDGTDGTDGTDGSDGTDGTDGDENDSNDEESDDDTDSDDDPGGTTGGSTGGSTGGAPPADDGEQFDSDAELTAERTGGGDLSVAVADGSAGERVAASVNGSASGTAALSRLALTPANDGNLKTTLEPADSPPAPDDAAVGLLELAPNESLDVERATYEFVVRDEAYARAPGALRVYAADGDGWRRLDADATANGSAVRVNATADRLSRVALAAASADVRATDVAVEGEAVAGSPTTVTSTLENEDGTAGAATVELRVDGTVADATRVVVPANGTTAAALNATFGAPGEYRVAVAGAEETIEAVPADAGPPSVTELALSNETVRVGDRLAVEATYGNEGEEDASTRATFAVAGRTVAEQRVSVEPGERETVAFEHAFERPGTYTVRVDDERRTVEVVEADAARPPSGNGTVTDSDSGLAGSGLGESGLAAVVAGFGALLAGAAAVNRWS